jgi:hypothetical protein
MGILVQRRDLVSYGLCGACRRIADILLYSWHRVKERGTPVILTSADAPTKAFCENQI